MVFMPFEEDEKKILSFFFDTVKGNHAFQPFKDKNRIQKNIF